MDWTKIPSLAALRAFEAAARNQSFSRAGRELNVTHAAIAQHVRALEDEFSEPLIERQGRGVVATDAGRQLAESLRDGFATVAGGVEDLRARRSEGPLNISVTPSFAAHWLMPRIGDFWQRQPDIPVSITPSEALVDLVADKIDLAVRYGNGTWPGVRSELLTEGEYWVVAHPDLVGDRASTRLQDLLDLPWLMESYMMERKIIIERLGVDFSAVKMTVLMTNDMVMAAAEAGLGVTAQPKFIVEREIAKGGLVKLCNLPETGFAYHLVTRPGRVSDRLKVFMDWLRSRASDS